MRLLCPICRRPTDSESDADFPFCSERCRLVDLGNWASEKYKVSSPAMMDESERESEEGSEDERSADRRKRPPRHASQDGASKHNDD